MTHSFSNFLPWETKKPKNVDGHTNILPRKQLIRPALMPNQSNSDYYILVKANATSTLPCKQSKFLPHLDQCIKIDKLFYKLNDVISGSIQGRRCVWLTEVKLVNSLQGIGWRMHSCTTHYFKLAESWCNTQNAHLPFLFLAWGSNCCPMLHQGNNKTIF